MKATANIYTALCKQPKQAHTVKFALTLGISLLLANSPTSAQQLSPSDAAESARSFTGGRVLKVKPFSANNDVDYRVKMLLPEGKVRNVIVDGDNGKASFRQKNTNTKKLKPTGPPPSGMMQGLR